MCHTQVVTMNGVATIGETMALLSAPNSGRLRDMTCLQLSVAGAESNVAIGIRRLGHEAAWIGRVGADEFGELVLSVLRRESVDVSGAIVDGASQTGLMIKERRFNVSRVSYYRAGSAGSRLCEADIHADLVRHARILHVTGVTLGISESCRKAVHAAVALARSADVVVSFDLNYRAALWDRDEAARQFIALATQADIVFASEDEIALLAENPSVAAVRLREGGTATVVVKRGAQGASVLDEEGWLDEPAITVPVVDPVGAGDAFVAGYLTGVLRNLDRGERLRLGCAVGACVVSAAGDWEGLPAWEDVACIGVDPGTTVR